MGGEYTVRVRYFMQYVAGTTDLILEAISHQMRDINLLYCDDSAAVFDSESPAAEVASLPFVKNSFVVLASTLRRDVDRGVEQLGRSAGKSDLFPESAGTDQFLSHHDSHRRKAFFCGAKSKSSLESAIARRTGPATRQHRPFFS